LKTDEDERKKERKLTNSVVKMCKKNLRRGNAKERESKKCF
jgi:hypothetical protein